MAEYRLLDPDAFSGHIVRVEALVAGGERAAVARLDSSRIELWPNRRKIARVEPDSGS